MELSEPAILTQRKGFVAARPGRPAGANDPFFADLKGELVRAMYCTGPSALVMSLAPPCIAV